MAEAAAQFNIHEAKTHLSRIVERVERGEEIILSRAGTPVAKVVPIERVVRRAGRGSLKGTLVLAADWDSAEVNEEIADSFLGTP
ncbi:MAG: type II toxin-antitoxin system Phd/YefM family antitoxin [Micromonosporaceae bacterium]